MKIYCWVLTELLKESLIIKMFLNKTQNKNKFKKPSYFTKNKKRRAGEARGAKRNGIAKNVKKVIPQNKQKQKSIQSILSMYNPNTIG